MRAHMHARACKHTHTEEDSLYINSFLCVVEAKKHSCSHAIQANVHTRSLGENVPPNQMHFAFLVCLI